MQGKGSDDGERLLDEACALERAGAFAIVLEAIPGELAERISGALTVPTIGIGAGVGCAGQVLVLHDLLGLTSYAGGKKPRFVKEYANLRDVVVEAVSCFQKEVREESFPARMHTYGVGSESTTQVSSGKNGRALCQ